jgi:hypothetical protein
MTNTDTPQSPQATRQAAQKNPNPETKEQRRYIDHQPSAQRVNIDNDKGPNQVHKTSSEDDFRGSLQQVEFESIPKRGFLDPQPSAQRVTSDDAKDSQIGHQLDQADEDSSDDYSSPSSTGSQSKSEAQSPKQGGDCSDE